MTVIKLIDREEWERGQSYHDELLSPIFQLLEQVKDPEIPALSIWDMGILRRVEKDQDTITVTITPTYSGCPAMDLITEDIHNVLVGAGYSQVSVVTRLSPAWTTSWMNDDARERMRGSGIAPPDPNGDPEHPPCPLCGSEKTKRISQFGSTACKALYQCESCQEPFDYFKTF